MPTAEFLPKKAVFPKIDPLATIRGGWILGDVTIGAKAHIVNAVIRADEGTPFYIGASSNVQDGAVIHAHYSEENEKPVLHNLVNVPDKGLFAVYIGNNVSITHQALIHGPAYIGDNSLIGFKATIHHANVGKNVEIGPHAYIEKVDIPDGVAIAPGAIITQPEDIEKYLVPHKNRNEKVMKVNHELAMAYHGTTLRKEYHPSHPQHPKQHPQAGVVASNVFLISNGGKAEINITPPGKDKAGRSELSDILKQVKQATIIYK